MNTRLMLAMFSVFILSSGCCSEKRALSHDLPKREMFGYGDEIALGTAIEKELAGRAFKENLGKAGKPSKIALNERFTGTTVEKLIEIHEKITQYGDNDNTDALLLRTVPADVQENIASTAAVFCDTDLSPIPGTKSYEIANKKTLRDTDVCETDKFLKAFLDQPADILHCTAFLIDSDVVAMAGHCLDIYCDIQQKRFVFGYYVQADGTVPTMFTEVFAGKKVLGRSGTTFGADWAVVQLDGTVAGHKLLTLRQADVALHEKLYMIGYPLGLPAKYAPNAEVISTDVNEDFYVANTDAFKTNSGSPVFDVAKNEVVGILYAGYIDRVPTGKCWIPSQCPQDGMGCAGESVARIKGLQYKK